MTKISERPSSGLDRFDLAILDILQKDNTTPQRVIGEQVNLSAPAVQRRIKRLQEQGIIRHNVAVIDQISLGRPITLIVEVEMETEKIDILDKTKERFLCEEAVQQCYYITGGADFVLIITASNMQEYEELTRKLFFSDPNIKRFRTSVAMETVKVGLQIPIHTT